MGDGVTCPECGNAFGTLRGFYSHWGNSSKENHGGETPDMDAELEFSDKHRTKIADAKEGHTHDEETREKIAKGVRGNEPWNKGMTKEDDARIQAVSEQLTGRTLPEDRVAQMSEVGKQAWKTGAYDGRKYTGSPGEKNAGYKDGSYIGGYQNYPDKFNQRLREQVRKRDNRICQLCASTPDTNKLLDVHHIDQNKDNCNMDNLISLCRSCHGKMNHTPEPTQRMAYSASPNADWSVTGRVV